MKKDSSSSTHTSTDLETKIIASTEFKAGEEDHGSFSGYGNNFGVLDSYDDITLPGAFSEGLKDFIDNGFGGVDHKWGIEKELGIVENAYEDATGLFIKVCYHPTTDAQLIRQKINNRISRGKKVSLSIGFRVIESEYVRGEEAASFLINPSQKILTYLKEREPIVRLLKKIKMYEVSPVSVGANPESEISEAKSARLASFQSAPDLAKKLHLLNLKLKAIS